MMEVQTKKKATAAQRRKSDLREEVAEDLAETAALAERVINPLREIETRALEDPDWSDELHEADAIRHAASSFGDLEPFEVARMCREIKDLEDHVERVAEECRQLVLRAKSKLRRAEYLFMPVIRSWGDGEQRTSKMSLRLPHTTMRLQWRKSKGRAKVQNEERTFAWLREQFKDDEAAEVAGVLKVERRLSETGLRDIIEGESREEIDIGTGEVLTVPLHVPGVEYTAGGESMSIVRGRAKK
jgi:hypothetical protein